MSSGPLARFPLILPPSVREHVRSTNRDGISAGIREQSGDAPLHARCRNNRSGWRGSFCFKAIVGASEGKRLRGEGGDDEESCSLLDTTLFVWWA